MNLADRLMKHILPEPNSGCWLWMGCILPTGYAYMTLGDRTKYAHRVSYETFKGPIPKDLQLDHLCRVRSCVNPNHLEPVTMLENIRRGNSGLANRSKTHCINGHLLSDENIYSPGKSQGLRRCRICTRIRNRVSYQKRKVNES